MKNISILLLLMMHGAMGYRLLAQSSTNLIQNSTFMGHNQTPDQWHLMGSEKPIHIENKSGLTFLRIHANFSITSGIEQIQPLPQGAKAISVHAWLKGKNIRCGQYDWQRGCFEFQFINDKGKRIGGFPKIMVPNANTWKKFHQVRQVPKGATALKIKCVNYDGTGTFDFTNLKIFTLAEKQLLLTSANSLVIDAAFKTKSRYAIYEPGEKITLQFTVKGNRIAPDQILWQLRNNQQALLQSGKIAVPAGSKIYQADLPLAPKSSGYFELHAILKSNGTTISKLGTRPAGCVTFGILPNLKALPIKHADDSRFGIQGTTFIQTGKFMQGDPYNEYYKMLGVRWVHRNRRLQELEPTPGSYKPKTNQASLKHSWPYDWNNQLATLVDAHSVPQWLIDGPENIKQKKRYSPTFDGQKYPPADYVAYGDILEKVARETANLKQHRFTYTQKNYYQIHWEPDWYWLGSDPQFVEMYRTAHQRIHKVDQDAMLLGCNFGVIRTGNDWLERMFKIGLGNYLDGIVTHAYYTYQAPPEVGIRPEIKRLVSMSKKFLKPDAPIIHSEWGLHWGKDYTVESVPLSKLHQELSESLRGHLIILGEGVDATWFFYAADHGVRGGGMAYTLQPVPSVGTVILSPKPLTMGVATLTRMLEGTQSLGSIDYLGPHVLGYAFNRAGKKMIALWSTDGKTRDLTLPAKATAKVYDCFGNPQTIQPHSHSITVNVSDLPIYITDIGNATIPENNIAAYPGDQLQLNTISSSQTYILSQGQQSFPVINKTIPPFISTGQWLLAKQNNQTGKLSDLSKLQIQTPYQTKLIPHLNGKTTGYQLQIKNISRSSRSIRIQCQGALKNIHVPVNQTVNILLQPSDMSLNRGQYEVAIQDIAGQNIHVSIPAKPILNTFKRSVKVDGNVRDWQLEMFQRVAGKDALAYDKAPLSGLADLSFDYALAYDDKALYAIFKVKDQTHLPPINVNESWRGDSIQIAMGSGLTHDGRWQSIRRFSFVLSKDTKKTDVRLVVGPPPLPPIMGQSLNPQIPCVIKRDEVQGITVYELAIPWAELSLANPIGRLEHIGFGAIINDADTLEQITADARKTMTVGQGAGLFTTQPTLGLFPLQSH